MRVVEAVLCVFRKTTGFPGLQVSGVVVVVVLLVVAVVVLAADSVLTLIGYTYQILIVFSFINSFIYLLIYFLIN